MRLWKRKYLPRKRRSWAVSALACLVAGCTVYTLTRPAVTMEEPGCQIPEHSHTQECYTQVTTVEKKVPSCGLKLHGHTPECYDGEGGLQCGYVDSVAHRHDALCYDGDGNLWCPLPELETHVHEDSCYVFSEAEQAHTHSEDCYTQERGELICEEHVHTDECDTENNVLICVEEHEHGEGCYEVQRERSCGVETDHQHTDSCYHWEQTLICQLPTEPMVEKLLICDIPQIPEHQHSEDCFVSETEPEPLTCTLPEDESHTHTDLCYGVWELTCGQEEHIHVDECDAPADEEEIPALTEQQLTAEIYSDSTYGQPWEDSNITITVSGLLPEGAAVKAYPVQPDFEELAQANILCTYDITIFTVEGEMFQPAEEAPLTVAFCLPQEPNQEAATYDNGNALTVETVTVGAAHISDTGELEQMASTVAGNTVSFAAEHFSTFVVYQTTQLREITPGESVEDDSAFRALAEQGYFTYWERFLTGDSDGAPYQTPGSVYALARGESYAPSASQITQPGGSVLSPYDDGVSVSKTIAGTDIENVFDITLRVSTSTNISEFYREPDVAVAIVMDISNTMRDNFGGISRYQAAMDSAERFIDALADASNGISKVGFVAFNTDAHEIFGLSSCANVTQATSLKNTMRQATGAIIGADGYGTSHSRYTNIEAGLQRGYDMLKNAKNENKYIIFLSDGFPTTYIKSGYTGYDPWMMGNLYYSYDHLTNPANIENPEVFCDRADTSSTHPYGKYCLYSVSYSDTGAIRARTKAQQIKAGGVKIFSIGIAIGDQTIEGYDIHRGESETFSIIQRTSFDSYEIGGYNNGAAYKTWLGNSIGSGSGYYYDSTDKQGMLNAYQDIFRKIQESHEEGASAQWVTNDPMGTVPDENIEFIGFFSKNGNLVLDYEPLTGTWEAGAENTASVDDSHSQIRWDLKNSGYSTATAEGVTMYHYSLTYRVRLENEQSDFIEYASYNTNNTTTLTYRTFTIVDGNTTFSDLRTIDFPIPAVKGYLGELTFEKQGTDGNLLAGAIFTLTHDTENCALCRGNGEPVAMGVMTGTSGTDGVVRFANIPSGHIYKLEETQAPPGHLPNADTYSVTVAYDTVTVHVTEGTWNGIIVNETQYCLPDTGGGAIGYTLGGLLLMAVGCTFVYYQTKRGKGDLASF